MACRAGDCISIGPIKLRLPTEAALLWIGGPCVLAAWALIHAEGKALPGIEHPVNELWLCAALAAWSLKGLAGRNADDVGIGGHALALRLGGSAVASLCHR
jgi:hypothetical protein